MGCPLGGQEQAWYMKRGIQTFCLQSLTLNVGLMSLVHTGPREKAPACPLAPQAHVPECWWDPEGLDDPGLCVCECVCVL